MDNSLTPTTMVKLPIWKTLQEAVFFIWKHRLHFVRLLILPTALNLLVSMLGDTGVDDAQEITSQLAYSWLFLDFLPHGIILAMFAVACHRSILLGPEAVTKFGFAGWSLRETRFFGWTILIYIFAWGFVFFFSIFGGIFGGVVGVVINRLFAISVSHLTTQLTTYVVFFWGLLFSGLYLYLVARSSLVLPATAVDGKPSFPWSWNVTKKNGWRLVILIGIIPLCLMAIAGSIGWFVEATSNIFWDPLGGLIYYVGTTLEIAVLSLSFKKLSGWPNVTQYEWRPNEATSL